MIRTVLRVMSLSSLALALAINSPAVFAQAGAGPQAERQESGNSLQTGQTSPSGGTPASDAPSASAPQASSSDIDGETMFATSCGWCHAQGGRAAGRGPKLAGINRSDAYIVDRIKRGKPGAMPAYHMFSEAQIIAILAYIRGLEASQK